MLVFFFPILFVTYRCFYSITYSQQPITDNEDSKHDTQSHLLELYYVFPLLFTTPPFFRSVPIFNCHNTEDGNVHKLIVAYYLSLFIVELLFIYQFSFTQTSLCHNWAVLIITGRRHIILKGYQHQTDTLSTAFG